LHFRLGLDGLGFGRRLWLRLGRRFSDLADLGRFTPTAKPGPQRTLFQFQFETTGPGNLDTIAVVQFMDGAFPTAGFVTLLPGLLVLLTVSSHLTVSPYVIINAPLL
jgi:hypothetical protein